MRPPLNAGENGHRPSRRRPDLAASMRPPLNAGENCRTSISPPIFAWCFNEAPAERGGERAMRADAVTTAEIASMRPPLNAGENHVAAISPAAVPDALQ